MKDESFACILYSNIRLKLHNNYSKDLQKGNIKKKPIIFKMKQINSLNENLPRTLFALFRSYLRSRKFRNLIEHGG